MLVNLNLRNWEARKQDKTLSRDTARSHQVNEKHVRVHRSIIDPDRMKKIKSAVSAIRTFHYDNTLPWYDRGPRLLTVARFSTYQEGLAVLKGNLEKEWESFFKEYPSLREQAKKDLNGLFNEADYPTDVRSMFSVSVEISPIPDSEDVRLSLSDEHIENVKNEIERVTQERMEGAVRDLWSRLYEKVGRMVERLSKEDGIFRDTLVKNIKAVVDLISEANITNDPNLDAMKGDVDRLLTTCHPEDLRRNKDLRSKVCKDAEGLLKRMEGYCNLS
jgi:hypothetical protein